MVAKMTSKNQITIPKAVASKFASSYFDVRQEEGRIILTPVNPDAAAQVRAKFDELGISESDIADAVKWARTAQ
jgi:bifunctional DNA-binding transcriptional regulator/antitoxin component of YhaV-PrlF toxin-antitoxin module